MSPFSRRAIALFTLAMCALLLPAAYTAADEDGLSRAAAVEASPSPEPTPESTPSQPPEEPDPTPTPTPAEPTAAPSPSPDPMPTPSTVGPRIQGEEENSPLHLSLGVAPATIEVGQETTVGITLTNPNDAPAENVEAVVTLPRELGYVSSEPAPGSVSTLGHQTVVSFDGLEVPAQGWLTIAVIAEGIEETKGRPATIDARAVWQDSEPFETATINVVAQPSDLRLTTSGPGLLSTVGETVVYRITLRNAGDAPLFDVALVNLVPAEVHVTSAGLAPGVDGVQVGSSGNAEDVVWSIDEMDPGEVIEVSYRGVVEKPGDLEVLNRTRAVAGSAEAAEDSERSYLATSAGGDSDNPSFDPVVERRVITEKVVERPLIRRRLPTEPGGVASTAALPFTGLDPWGTAAVGIMLIGFGVMFVRFGSRDFDRRRVVSLALLILLIGGACISSDSGSEGPDDARVKGRQIERDDAPDDDEDVDSPDDDESGPAADPRGADGRGGERETPAPDDDPFADEDEPGDEDVTDDGDDDGSPVVAEPPEPETEVVLVPGPPVTSFERHVVTNRLTQDELAIESVSSISDVARAAFTWNDAASAGGGTASSRHEGLVRITTSVVPSGYGMRATVTITNITERTRVAVSGRLDLVISGGGGGSLATLSGRSIDVVLNPEGETSAAFNFRLPSGSYAATGLLRSR